MNIERCKDCMNMFLGELNRPRCSISRSTVNGYNRWDTCKQVPASRCNYSPRKKLVEK